MPSAFRAVFAFLVVLSVIGIAVCLKPVADTVNGFYLPSAIVRRLQLLANALNLSVNGARIAVVFIAPYD